MWPTADVGVAFSPPGQAKQPRVLPVGVTGREGMFSMDGDDEKADCWRWFVFTVSSEWFCG